MPIVVVKGDDPLEIANVPEVEVRKRRAACGRHRGMKWYAAVLVDSDNVVDKNVNGMVGAMRSVQKNVGCSS